MKWFELYITCAWLLRLAMILVILRRQLAPGASIAWLGIIFLHPYIGSTLYLFLGERRLGPHRVLRHKELVASLRPAIGQSPAASLESIDLPLRYEPMVRQAERISGLPVLGANSLDFLTDATAFATHLAADIDAATHHVHLLYYIMADDALSRPVTDALARAAKRGVTCRLLIDAVGSRAVLRRHAIARRLQSQGVHVAAALPAAFIQRRLPRMDLRNHRKLAVIDDRLAYVGSHNLIHPDYGGRRGGPWVDLSARVSGPAVAELAGVFAEDWAFETEQLLPLCPPTPDPSPSPFSGGPDARNPLTPATGVPIQIVPTGPAQAGATYRRLLLAAIQAARSQLTLTTPYFVPDEPTLVSLVMAADRGVAVRLILPERPDHPLTAAAGRATFERLMDAGIAIHLYRPGLLHAKTVTVDDALSLFGSANLDVRSFNLNFELSTLLYGRDATQRLLAIQEQYLTDSRPLDPYLWSHRPTTRRYADNAISLLSPLL